MTMDWDTDSGHLWIPHIYILQPKDHYHSSLMQVIVRWCDYFDSYVDVDGFTKCAAMARVVPEWLATCDRLGDLLRWSRSV